MTHVLRGKWALITGASSGLGADFARQLAALGASVVLTARREDRLQSVADEIRRTYGVQAEVIALDLARDGAPQQLHDQLAAAGRSIDVLINNAGFGLYGRFTAMEWSRMHEMLQIDITTVVHMTRLFAADMVARKSGYILQVSSIGAFTPSPLYASYSAAKSFVLHFSEAVNYELRGTGVSITTTCPGPTETEFLAVAGQERTWYQRLTMMKSPDVVRASLNAMFRRKGSIVPGLLNAFSAWSIRLLPRRLSTALAERTMLSN